MKYIRPRLTVEDLELIVSALSARKAATAGLRRHRVARLQERLAEIGAGNPKWRFSEVPQTHEEDLDLEEMGEE